MLHFRFAGALTALPLIFPPLMSGLSTAAFGASLFAAKVTISFHDEAAIPVIINGQPTLEHRFWACIDRVRVEFTRPVSLAALAGQVFGVGEPMFKRAFVMRELPEDQQNFTFVAAGNSFCNDANAIKQVVVAGDIRSLDNAILGDDVRVTLSFPPSHD